MTNSGGAANMAAEVRGRGCDAATSRISAYWCTRIVSVGPCGRGSARPHQWGQSHQSDTICKIAYQAANVRCGWHSMTKRTSVELVVSSLQRHCSRQHQSSS